MNVNNAGLSRTAGGGTNDHNRLRSQPGFDVRYYAHTAELPDRTRDPNQDHWQPLSTVLRIVFDQTVNLFNH